MATSPDTRLKTARRFGYEIGGAALLLALLLLWRGRHPGVATITSIAGIAALLLAVLRPAALAPLAAAWLRVGDVIARVTTPVFLTLIYLVVVTPVGVVRRTFTRSPIRRDPDAASFWQRRAPSTPESRRSAMEHQF